MHSLLVKQLQVKLAITRNSSRVKKNVTISSITRMIELQSSDQPRKLMKKVRNKNLNKVLLQLLLKDQKHQESQEKVELRNSR